MPCLGLVLDDDADRAPCRLHAGACRGRRRSHLRGPVVISQRRGSGRTGDHGPEDGILPATPGDPWLRIPTLLLVLLGAGLVARRAWREIPLVVPFGASCCCWPLAVAYLSWTSFVMPMRPSTCSAPAPMSQAHLYRVDQHSRHVGTQRTAVALPAYSGP